MLPVAHDRELWRAGGPRRALKVGDVVGGGDNVQSAACAVRVTNRVAERGGAGCRAGQNGLALIQNVFGDDGQPGIAGADKLYQARGLSAFGLCDHQRYHATRQCRQITGKKRA